MASSRNLHLHVLIGSLTWGGAETLLADFARGATDAGLELSVGYLSEKSESAGKLRSIGIEPESVPIRSMLGRADRRLVRDHVAAHAPDLLHTHLGYPDFLGGLAARSLGIPTVSTLHVMEWRGTLRDRFKDGLMSWARRRCAYRVIAVSEAQRQSYLAIGWDRPEHVVTIPNGIVAEFRPGEGKRVRADLGLKPDDLVVAMVAVLREGKGHDIAIDAVAELRQRFPQLRLLIVGDGPLRADVERMAQKLGDSAILTGYRDNVLGFLDAADILLQPSRVDAFPTSLIEAAATRVPVVATAVGGIPEIVVAGETGLLIEPPPTTGGVAEALQALISDPSLRERLGGAARQRFDAKFTVTQWIPRLLDLYDEALRANEAPG
jgi:glycosyltransferase involved in cell wall biosynthesis